MADRNIEINELEKITDPKTKRVFRYVNYRANRENHQITMAKVLFVFNSIFVAVILGVDYMMAKVMFEALDPTMGENSLGPAFLALSVPIAVVAIHLLIANDKDKKHSLEYRLKRLAGVGVIVFLLGIASMFGLVLFDATDGLGASGQNAPIEGMIGDKDFGAGNNGGTSWILSVFRTVFASISPIIFFTGMTLILFVTVYVSHHLITKIEKQYEIFSGATRRSRELTPLYEQLDELILEIDILDAEHKALKKQLPGDPEMRFAQIASAAIYDALHYMKKALRGLGEPTVLLRQIGTRNATIPSYIKTRKQGLTIITEIRHHTSPYTIMKNLGALPPKEEEE